MKELDIYINNNTNNDLTKLFLDHIKETKKCEMESNFGIIRELVNNITEKNNDTNNFLLEHIQNRTICQNDYILTISIFTYSLVIMIMCLFI